MRKRRLIGAILVPLALMLSVSIAAAPAASAKKGIVHPKLLKPKKNGHVNKHAKFRVRDKSPSRPGNPSPHTLWVIVSKHKKTNRFGELKHKNYHTSTFFSLKHKRHSTYVGKLHFGRSGRYFWQAFRIDCSVDLPIKQDCHVLSKIRKLHVRR